jgi:hypothetical protein
MNRRRIARTKAYAMLGEKERALAELRAAIGAGYRVLYDLDSFTRLDLDPTMQSLAGEPRFKAMIREVEASNEAMRRALLARAPAVPT